MKRKVLFVASLFLATATFAQDGLTSKKGEAYLPEAGDWSIGFDGTSLTQFIGNAFNGSGNSTSVIDPTSGVVTNGGSTNSLNAGGWMNGTVGQEIRFKMFKDETTAYRLRARIGFGGDNSDAVGKYDQDGDPLTQDVDYTVNTKNSDGFSVILGAGLEKRRGNTRVQGYYGGEVVFGMIGNGTTTTDDGRVLSDDYSNGGVTRTTEVANASSIVFGLQGFIGVEYFFAPKMSVGAEIAWGINFNSTGNGETTNESSDGTTITSTTTETGGSSSFGIDVTPNSIISLNFHF